MKNKIWVAVVLSLVITLGIVLCTVDSSTWQAVRSLNYSYLIVILLLLIGAWCCNGLRLKVLAKGVGFNIPILIAIELGLVDRFFSNITPSGIGGQPIKILALTKNNISSGKASAIVVIELILRLLFFIFSLPYVFIKLHNLFINYVSTQTLVSGLSVFIVGLVIIIYFLLYRPRYLVLVFFWILNRSLLRRVFDEKKRYSLKRKFAEEIRVFYQTIWIYVKAGVGKLVVAFFLTALLWGLRFTILYFIIKGFNLHVSLVYLVLLQLLIYTIVIFIPIPGGSGVEVIMASLLHQVLPVGIIGLVVASWRFLTYYTYIIFGGLVTFKVFHLQAGVNNLERRF